MSDFALIPAGAHLDRVYWSAPSGYNNPGPEFTSRIAALRYAIQEMSKAVGRHEQGLNGKHLGAGFIPLPERITIDLRWKMTWTGGGVDRPVERSDYPDIAAAQKMLDILTHMEDVKNESLRVQENRRLDHLPDGRYFDGTYEWDKEGSDWTPLRAPSGMPSRPPYALLRKVVTHYEAIQ